MPINLDTLTWTDRETVCAQLAAFLDTPPSPARETDDPDPEHDQRCRAVLLLSHMGGAYTGELLTRILLDPAEDDDTRLAALDELRRQGVRLPASCLDALQIDDRLWYTPGWPGELGDYLSLVETGSGSARHRKLLKRIGPQERARQLIRFLVRPVGDSAGVREWLYEQWVRKDSARLEAAGMSFHWENGRNIHLNVKIASLTRDRPESAAMLEKHRLLPAEKSAAYVRLCGTLIQPDGWEAAPAELWTGTDEVVEAVRTAPQAYQKHAEDLNLPYEGLLEYFTPETLMARIEAEIRGASEDAALAVSHGNWTTPVYRALELLEKCPDNTFDAGLESLALCPDIHWYVQDTLHSIRWERIWRFAADTCREKVRRWTQKNSCSRDRGRALLRLAAAPRPEDSEFFLRCIDEPEKPEFRYRAIEALETLGKDSSVWRSRLVKLARDTDPLVSIQARTALYRRGDAGQLDRIAKFAHYSAPGEPACSQSHTFDTDSEPNLEEKKALVAGAAVRAEALMRLAESAPDRYREVFEAVLRLKRGWYGWYWPATDLYEAAYQLACLDDDAARTVLLRAGLNGPSWLTEWIGEHALRPGIQPSPPRPRDTLSHGWRWQLPWEWRCC